MSVIQRLDSQFRFLQTKISGMNLGKMWVTVKEKRGSRVQQVLRKKLKNVAKIDMVYIIKKFIVLGSYDLFLLVSPVDLVKEIKYLFF